MASLRTGQRKVSQKWGRCNPLRAHDSRDTFSECCRKTYLFHLWVLAVDFRHLGTLWDGCLGLLVSCSDCWAKRHHLGFIWPYFILRHAAKLAEWVLTSPVSLLAQASLGLWGHTVSFSIWFSSPPLSPYVPRSQTESTAHVRQYPLISPRKAGLILRELCLSLLCLFLQSTNPILPPTAASPDFCTLYSSRWLIWN